MTTRQYIGARYIPVFADPVQWDSDNAYEYLTMVQSQGETYMSKQNVPIGATLPDISQGEESNEFWVHMSNWNAQVETYRQEVLQYNGRITAVENGVTALNGAVPIANFDSTNTVKKYIDDNIEDIEEIIPNTEFDSVNTVKKYIDDNIDAIEAIIPSTAFDSVNTIDKAIDDLSDSMTDYCVWIGDSYSTSTYAHGSTNQPCNKIPQALNCTVKNYAQNGAGFLRDVDINFAKQAQTAVNDTSYPHSQVKWVFIFGGQNDVYRWISDYTGETAYNTLVSRFNDCMTRLKSEFTNARIILIGVNSPKSFLTPTNTYNPLNGNCISEAGLNRTYKQLAINNGIGYIDTTFVNVGFPSNFDSVDNHPNDRGYITLTSAIISSLFGNNSEPGLCCPPVSGYPSIENTDTWVIEYPNNDRSTWNITKTNVFGRLEDGHYKGTIEIRIGGTPTTSTSIIIKPPMNFHTLPYGQISGVGFSCNNGVGVSSAYVNVVDNVSAQSTTGIKIIPSQNLWSGFWISVQFDFAMR